MSTILLGNIGKASSGQRMGHINIFFCYRLGDKKELEIIYCSTGDMTADLLTKPLQASQFKKF